MFKLDLEKAEEPEIKLPTSAGYSKKQESSRKTSTSALLTMPKCLCESQQSVENSSRDGNIRPPDLPFEKFEWEQEATISTRHGTTDWFQIGKGVHQGCILSLCLFNLQTASCEMLGWMKYKVESRLPGEISITSDMQMTSPLWQKAKNKQRAS